MRLYDYAGIIHFHSAYSFDGHVKLDKVLQAAARNGIDFLILTDHDNLRARDDGWEGWQGKVLLIVGIEIAPRFNHYLGFNIKKAIVASENSRNVEPQQYINQVNAEGGFGFIAHPDHEGTKTFHVKHYPWQDWSVDGYTGIGIWDFMTDWQSSLKRYLPSLISFFFPAFFLRGPRQITLARWDLLNQGRKVVGIGELDNHASLKNILGMKVEVFSFDKAFKFVRTHICTQEQLTGNATKDINLLYEALRNGCCYVALEYFKPAKRFRFLVRQSDKEYNMGDSVFLESKTEIIVSVPARAFLKIIRNGNSICELTGTEIHLPIEKKGIYRTEAYLKIWGKYRPWIFSNPVFVC